LSGKGRLDEPENIVGFLQDWFKKKSPLTNKVALVTAGPTFERIDPVRFIGNFSSGKMGFAIAETLAEQGARVILISGPTALTTTHTSIELQHVESAAEMHEACMRFQPESDVIVMAAAVADYTPATVSDQKLKKESGIPLLELKPTVDILADLGSHKITGQMLVGFALETHDALEHAQKKLQNKNLDLIVLNSLEDQGAGFGVDTNKITIIDKHKNIQTYSLKSKKEVALDIVNKINDLLNF
jgi:phosphopantothenoylcysteine decarboxylase/phosphopantothenate--cysteine ligase